LARCIEVLGHHPVDRGHGDRGDQEHDMDHDLPLDRVFAQVGGVDEGLQQVDRRDADDGRRQLDLEHAGIDVRQPLGLVGMAFEVEARDEGLVAADDDHDQQVGDHHHVDQAEHGQHDVGLADALDGDGGVHEVVQFDHEQPAIDDLGDDQAEVKGGLDPAAPEDEVLHRLDDLIHGSCRPWGGAAILPQAGVALRRGCVSHM
jgi:hypothetical protein